jgi:RNA polymerase sigma-70 factor (ECF subfamily)
MRTTMRIKTDQEFENLINLYYKLFFKIAFSYVRDEFEGEDIVQDALATLLNTHKDFESLEHVKNWVIKVIINKSINYLREKSKITLSDELVDNIQDNSNNNLSNNLNNYEIRECVYKLKVKNRNIIILYYFNGLDIKAISKILNISTSNVTTRLNRARLELKKMIEERRKNDGEG